MAGNRVRRAGDVQVWQCSVGIPAVLFWVHGTSTLGGVHVVPPLPACNVCRGLAPGPRAHVSTHFCHPLSVRPRKNSAVGDPGAGPGPSRRRGPWHRCAEAEFCCAFSAFEWAIHYGEKINRITGLGGECVDRVHVLTWGLTVSCKSLCQSRSGQGRDQGLSRWMCLRCFCEGARGCGEAHDNAGPFLQRSLL